MVVVSVEAAVGAVTGGVEDAVSESISPKVYAWQERLFIDGLGL